MGLVEVVGLGRCVAVRCERDTNWCRCHMGSMEGRQTSRRVGKEKVEGAFELLTDPEDLETIMACLGTQAYMKWDDDDESLDVGFWQSHWASERLYSRYLQLSPDPVRRYGQRHIFALAEYDCIL